MRTPIAPALVLLALAFATGCNQPKSEAMRTDTTATGPSKVDKQAEEQALRDMVADGGDLAAERGTYQISWTGPKGKKMEDHGNYVTVWKKVSGQWKVLSDINASEVAGAM